MQTTEHEFLNRRKANLGALIPHKRPCNDILDMKEVINKIPCKECEVVYLGTPVKQSKNLEREQRSILLLAKRPFFLKQFIRASKMILVSHITFSTQDILLILIKFS